jgi:hypothetical protein
MAMRLSFKYGRCSLQSSFRFGVVRTDALCFQTSTAPFVATVLLSSALIRVIQHRRNLFRLVLRGSVL